MAVDLSKVMNLADGKEIYKDLRNRIKNAGNVKDVTVGGISVLDENGVAIIVLPTVPVTDVQVNGSSILNNGIATIPLCDGGNTHGLVRVMSSQGVGIMSGGILKINPADSSDVKGGAYTAKALVPNTQHRAVFFGLSKVAGVDLKDETVTLGTYPDASKQAILKMLGLDGIFGDFENSAVASKAYAIGETFIYNGKRYRATAAIAISDVIAPGTNCVLDPLDGRYVKKIDYASSSNAGVVKIRTAYGIGIDGNTGELKTFPAVGEAIKSGTDSSKPITPSKQHESAFYGLAKAAGDTTQSQSVNAVGTYTAEAKTAIQNMFGFDGIFGNYELSTTASKAYAIGETFIYNGKRYRVTAAIAINDVIAPGTNCELDPLDGRYVKNTDIATEQAPGLVQIDGAYGVAMRSAPNNHILRTFPASSNSIKAGAHIYQPIVPNRQHESVFFGLAKAADADMASLSDVTVGQYPQAQKTAIQTMLGIEADIPLIEEVSGATPSITGMPNVRYICGTCSLLTITPPASGSIVVRFTSGSTPTVLTVPNTVKFPVWFDYTSLEADTTYEIIITDGVYGGVMSWAD